MEPAAKSHVVVLGLNQKRATLALREGLSFPNCDLAEALAAMRQAVPEAAILSTCHRVELYAVVSDLRKGEADLKRFWARNRGVPIADFEPHVYYLTGRKALEHLFSVASGLDSAIIGEPQILGQVREALRLGQETGAMGPLLSSLFRHAIICGKRARTQTAIARNAASISYAAVEMARRALGDLTGSRVLLIGAGKMGELAAQHLLARGVAGISVVGRSEERARRLALKCGNAGSLDQLEDALLVSDIVISCTNAPHHVISRDLMRRVMRVRGRRPVLLIDIAVPRDIDPAVGDLPGVRLHNVDDLEFAVATNMKERQAEARRVIPIIDEEIAVFEARQRTLAVTPAIRDLRRRADAILQEELARTSAVLGRLPEEDRKRIEALAKAIEKKLLHQPISLLRAEAAAGNGVATEEALRRLFDLEPQPEAPAAAGRKPAKRTARRAFVRDVLEA